MESGLWPGAGAKLEARSAEFQRQLVVKRDIGQDQLDRFKFARASLHLP